MKTRDNILLVT